MPSNANFFSKAYIIGDNFSEKEFSIIINGLEVIVLVIYPPITSL